MTTLDALDGAASDASDLLHAAGQTLGLCETASGGLMSAAMLARPGASRCFVGGAVAYSRASRHALLDLHGEQVRDLAPMSPEMALAFARRTRERLGSDWGVAELGIAGPGPSPYGGPSGVAILAVSGPVDLTRRIETGHDDRAANMRAFAAAGLALLAEALAKALAEAPDEGGATTPR